jgi:predicted PurR-regulated permease PerM
MKKEFFFSLLIFLIIGVSFYWFYLIFSPYLSTIAWAVILTLALNPIYRRLSCLLGDRRSLASLLATILTILIIVVPAVLVLLLLINELGDVYKFFEAGVKAGKFQFLLKWRETPWLIKHMDRVGPWLNLSQVDIQGVILDNVKRFSTYFLNQSTKAVTQLSQFLFSFFLMAISMFFLFRDGESLLKAIKGLIPLDHGEKELLFRRIKEMVDATILGGVLVSIVQGFLGGLAFWFLDLPSPVLWGSVMAILAFLPVIGPILAWGPASIFLFLNGLYGKAIILIVWGTFVVGLSDNFLRPILISGRTKLHPMILFFAVLGGISAFGFIGVIAGPLVVTICLAILDIYSSKLEIPDAGEWEANYRSE